eukprot:11521907-Alexandrium_andersonii.AAC.1
MNSMTPHTPPIIMGTSRKPTLLALHPEVQEDIDTRGKGEGVDDAQPGEEEAVGEDDDAHQKSMRKVR